MKLILQIWVQLVTKLEFHIKRGQSMKQQTFASQEQEIY